MIYEERIKDSAEQKAQKTAGEAYSPEEIDKTILETIAYQYPKRKIAVESTTEEFTCLCPYSGLPDFAKLTIRYVPRRKLIELKSLKYYLYSFRNVKIYNEHVVNKILEDLKQSLDPYEITIVGEFSNRGGIKNRATAGYKKPK